MPTVAELNLQWKPLNLGWPLYNKAKPLPPVLLFVFHHFVKYGNMAIQIYIKSNWAHFQHLVVMGH